MTPSGVFVSGCGTVRESMPPSDLLMLEAGLK